MCRARYEASRCPLRYGRPHRTGTHFRLASFSCVATFTRVTPHTPRVHGFTAMPRADSCAPYDRSRFRMGVFLHLDVAPYTLFQEPSKLACLQRRGIAHCGVAYRRPWRPWRLSAFIEPHLQCPGSLRYPANSLVPSRFPLSRRSSRESGFMTQRWERWDRMADSPVRCGVSGPALRRIVR